MSLKTISLFTGIGGLDLGLEAAGFEPVICVERDATCLSTLAHNRSHWKIADPADLQLLDPEELLAQAGLKAGEAALVAGGPPCQPYSKARLWSGHLTNGDSNGALGAFMAVVEVAQPRAFLLENVDGLATAGVLQSAVERLNQGSGEPYEVVTARLNAADFGVPQIRQRFFAVGVRGTEFAFPEPLPEEDRRTAWDALGDLEDQAAEEVAMTGKWADLLPSIPEGQNYQWHTPRGDGEPLFGWRTRYWSFLLKLAKDRPSWTITASPGPATGPFHWDSRRLSRRELCRLQTFPDDFDVQGSLRDVQRQVGNAVPPLLAEHLGRALGRALGTGMTPSGVIHALAKRGPATDAAPTEPVPERYMRFKGAHADHPGTGAGPGSRGPAKG